MNRTIIAVTLFSFVMSGARAQKSEKKISPPIDRITMGLGVGFDYAGFGSNLTVYPLKNIGLFGGIGYTTIGLGYTAGVKLRLLFNDVRPSISPFVTGMYGYYAAVKVKDVPSLSEQFQGYTIGLGFDTPIKPTRAGYWSFALLFPQRGIEVDDYIARNRINLDAKLLPIGISIGYKIMIYRE